MRTNSTKQTGAGASWLATALPIASALVPLVYLVWMCRRFYVDVPFGDEWELVPRLDKLDRGALSLTDVWRQHNEHRPMFPVITQLALARATGWNMGPEIALNVLMGIAIFALVAVNLRPTGGDRVGGLWLLPLLALIVFSPVQWENWLWGWQISFFMGVLAATAGFFLLSRAQVSTWPFAGAVACGVVTTYSVAAGLVYWFVGLAGLCLDPRLRRGGRGLVWLTAASATYAPYFYHYEPPNFGQPSMLSNFGSFGAFKTLLVYIAGYLGDPVAMYRQGAAVAAGVVAVAAFVGLMIRLWSSHRDPRFVFPALLGFNAIAAAVLTGLGRAGFGSIQALSSRYTTVSELLWVGIILLVAGEATGRRRLGVIAVGILALSISVIASGREGIAFAAARHSFLLDARGALVSGSDSELLGRLYLNDAAEVQRRRIVLQRLRLSVFR